ncbi:UvrD-helicase domain-containing protein [Pseudobdellovibrio exovorus]|uniref:DNA 3'-5' helicase n=1 Tax=Pseudobdellovibrio exovorus JSS TaxID=1184267 RepID=M4VAE9_9BACT|nr:UvrD-helicase domain-containing protein [Pseudobdellovibrio exovorus]AGH96203.1 exonuclease RexA [Pseudobdellovibrio exovorus JSS]
MSSPTSDVVLGSQFIRAGAGAGKTTKLIGTFLNFVREFRQQQGRFPRVVMTTFTRKATQEVKERLLVSALKENEKEIFEYINKKSYVHISTIHGLLSIYLSQYAEQMKFPQDIRIVDSQQYVRHLKRQINELLKKHPEYLELLEQYSFTALTEISIEALELKSQYPKLSYANAKALQRISEGQKKAIVDEIEKILGLITAVPDKWQIYLDHLRGLAVSLQQGRELDFLQQLDNMPSKPVFSKTKPPFDVDAHNILEDLRAKKLKNLFDTENYIQKHEALNALFIRYLNELYSRMQEHRQNTGELTIADLETMSLQLSELHPETATEFSQSWDYFMVDEYQDTSPLQVKILNRLIGDRPCFVVGDPQQSIYLFRGARSEVFEQKMQEMQAQKAQIQFLETNYRSEASLMLFMNDFFADFSNQFRPMLTKPESSPKRNLPYDAYFLKSPEQVETVLVHIRRLLDQGVLPQDICVLSRNNSKLNEIAVRAAQVQIPVQLQAAAGFEEKREILDLIALNRFFNNPHDNENFVTLARSPWFFIEDSELLSLAHNPIARQQSLWASLQYSNSAQKEKFKKYLDFFNTRGASQTTQEFIKESRFMALSAAYDKTGKREANIFKFLTTLAQAERASGFSLGLFLDEQFLSLQSDLGSSSGEAQPVEQPDCVSLMTVHASKGLQFKHVIVIGFADTPQLSRTPKLSFDEQSELISLAVYDEENSKHQASRWAAVITEQFKERELKEHERVLYVAMTRAIESLTLVAETERHMTSESSWLKRSNWPEDGEHIGGKYRVLSLTMDEKLENAKLDKLSSAAVRPLFLTPQGTVEDSQSVTELISNPSITASATAEAASQFNEERTILNLKKAQKGSDLHRVFEALKYVDEEQLQSSLADEDKESLTYLLQLKEIDLKKILQAGHNEWGFGLKTPSRFIQGQIDLWAELEDEIHVLDYKTGSSFYSEQAFRQLSIYTQALLQMKIASPQKKIIQSVVYPVEKVVKQKVFANAQEFQKQMPEELKQLF